VGGPDSRWLDPVLDDPVCVDRSEGIILGKGVALISSSVSLPHLCLLSAAKLYVSKFEPNF
jgi:hypothetical protein